MPMRRDASMRLLHAAVCCSAWRDLVDSVLIHRPARRRNATRRRSIPGRHRQGCDRRFALTLQTWFAVTRENLWWVPETGSALLHGRPRRAEPVAFQSAFPCRCLCSCVDDTLRSVSTIYTPGYRLSLITELLGDGFHRCPAGSSPARTAPPTVACKYRSADLSAGHSAWPVVPFRGRKAWPSRRQAHIGPDLRRSSPPDE